MLTKRIDYFGLCGLCGLATSCDWSKCCNKCGLFLQGSCGCPSPCGEKKEKKEKPPKRKTKCCGVCGAKDKYCGVCGEHGDCTLCGVCGLAGCCWKSTPPTESGDRESDAYDNAEILRCCTSPCGKLPCSPPTLTQHC